MTGFCMIITTTGTKDLAKQIANELVVSGLSNCAQISAIESMYKWDGRVYDEPEFRLNIKAAKTNEKAVIAKIKEMHTYDLPQIISFDVTGGDAKYFEWLANL